jgi:tetratricopeptide (TPR) repeat protein
MSDSTSAADLEAPYEVSIDRACRAALRRRWTVSSERTKLTSIFAAIKAGKLRFADLTAAQIRQLWVVPMVDLLVQVSIAVRDDDPREMVELAQLGRLVVEKIDARRCGAHVISDLRARTSAELANAYRLTDNFPAAWEAIGEAIRSLVMGTGDLLLLARVADLTASLLASQRRFDEATELIDPLLELYEQLGDHHLVGRALIKKGTFASYAHQPAEALRLVVAGAELIDPRREAALPASVLQTIIGSTVEFGRYRQARILLWRMRAMRLLPNNHQDQLRFRWLEAKIYDGLGDHERAEKAFLQAREGFRQSGLVYPTALCGLDLASLWIRQGKRTEARGLIEEMIATFRSLGIAREALASLLLLREVCARDWESDDRICDRLRMITVYLTELERQPIPRRPPKRT